MTCDLCDKKEISSEFLCPFCNVFLCSQECLDRHMELYGKQQNAKRKT